MEHQRGTVQFQIETSAAVTLGKFDGLHRGHQLLLSRILEKRQEGLAAVLFTFDFGREKELMLPGERKTMLEQWGVDYLLECPFVPEISHMEPEEFVRSVLRDQLHAAYLAVGTDFRFGYQRRGDYELLQNMAAECGFTVEVVEKAAYQGRDISSTYIREALAEGNLPLANALLGYAYSVSGTIVHGRAMGRGLGMPTINVIPEPGKLLPPNGVYASRTTIEGREYCGITNIGLKPTVGGETVPGMETHLFDVDENLYGRTAKVALCAFERPEQKFASLEALKGQLARDVEWGRAWFQESDGEEI